MGQYYEYYFISTLALLAMIRNDEAINVIEFVMNTFQKTDSKTLAEMMNQQHPEKLYQMNKAIRKDMLLSKIRYFGKDVRKDFPWYLYFLVSMNCITNFCIMDQDVKPDPGF